MENLYDFRWRKWLEWCKEHNVPHIKLSSLQLANFLAYLHAQAGLSASSVRGYRSAIRTPILQLGGPSFESDPLLRDTVRGAALRSARRPRRVPQWELLLVLDCLRSPPFEPLSGIAFDLLTLKTTFLLALASRSVEVRSMPSAVLSGTLPFTGTVRSPSGSSWNSLLDPDSGRHHVSCLYQALV